MTSLIDRLEAGTAGEWQPIETAPRDGTRVRLGNHRAPYSMKQEALFKTTGVYAGEGWQMSAFFIVPGGQNGLLSSEPTHWQPVDPASLRAQGDVK